MTVRITVRDIGVAGYIFISIYILSWYSNQHANILYKQLGKRNAWIGELHRRVITPFFPHYAIFPQLTDQPCSVFSILSHPSISDFRQLQTT